LPISSHSKLLSFFATQCATGIISSLSLHDALPILGDDNNCDAITWSGGIDRQITTLEKGNILEQQTINCCARRKKVSRCIEIGRSEEHTSELQSRFDLVCRLLLEKEQNLNLTITML